MRGKIMSNTEVTAHPALPTQTPRARALDWVRRTWQPTQEQVQGLTRSARHSLESRLQGASDRLRGLLGGPTRDELNEVSRRLSRIEARLEVLGAREKEPKEKDRKTA